MVQGALYTTNNKTVCREWTWVGRRFWSIGIALIRSQTEAILLPIVQREREREGRKSLGSFRAKHMTEWPLKKWDIYWSFQDPSFFSFLSRNMSAFLAKKLAFSAKGKKKERQSGVKFLFCLLLALKQKEKRGEEKRNRREIWFHSFCSGYLCCKFKDHKINKSNLYKIHQFSFLYHQLFTKYHQHSFMRVKKYHLMSCIFISLQLGFPSKVVPPPNQARKDRSWHVCNNERKERKENVTNERIKGRWS